MQSLAFELTGDRPEALPEHHVHSPSSSPRRYTLIVSLVLGMLSVIAMIIPAEQPQAQVADDDEAQVAREATPPAPVPAPPRQVAAPTTPPPQRAVLRQQPPLTPPPAPGGPRDARDATELYTAAEAAHAQGQAGEAYKLALLSWRRSKQSKAAELLARSACELRDAAKVRAALTKVSRAQRSELERTCGLEL